MTTVPIVTKTACPRATQYRYAWDCPDCGAGYTNMRWAPENRAKALCYKCSEAHWEREFQKRHASMMQARIVSVESRGEKQKKKAFRVTLIGEDGRTWTLTGWGNSISVKEVSSQ